MSDSQSVSGDGKNILSKWTLTTKAKRPKHCTEPECPPCEWNARRVCSVTPSAQLSLAWVGNLPLPGNTWDTMNSIMNMTHMNSPPYHMGLLPVVGVRVRYFQVPGYFTDQQKKQNSSASYKWIYCQDWQQATWLRRLKIIVQGCFHGVQMEGLITQEQNLGGSLFWLID